MSGDLDDEILLQVGQLAQRPVDFLRPEDGAWFRLDELHRHAQIGPRAPRAGVTTS